MKPIRATLRLEGDESTVNAVAALALESNVLLTFEKDRHSVEIGSAVPGNTTGLRHTRSEVQPALFAPGDRVMAKYNNSSLHLRRFQPGTVKGVREMGRRGNRYDVELDAYDGHASITKLLGESYLVAYEPVT